MKSTHRLPSTPKAWEFVNIRQHSMTDKFALTFSPDDCYIGNEMAKAAGIPRPYELTFGQAVRFGAKLDAWLKKKGENKAS